MVVFEVPADGLHHDVTEAQVVGHEGTSRGGDARGCMSSLKKVTGRVILAV